MLIFLVNRGSYGDYLIKIPNDNEQGLTIPPMWTYGSTTPQVIPARYKADIPSRKWGGSEDSTKSQAGFFEFYERNRTDQPIVDSADYSYFESCAEPEVSAFADEYGHEPAKLAKRGIWKKAAESVSVAPNAHCLRVPLKTSSKGSVNSDDRPSEPVIMKSRRPVLRVTRTPQSPFKSRIPSASKRCTVQPRIPPPVSGDSQSPRSSSFTTRPPRKPVTTPRGNYELWPFIYL